MLNNNINNLEWATVKENIWDIQIALIIWRRLICWAMVGR